MRDVADALRRVVGAGSLQTNVALSSIGRWAIGGPADIVVTPNDGASASAVLRLLTEAGARHVLIGDGTNILFDDRGYRGVVVRIGRQFSDFAVRGDQVEAGAGLWVPCFVRRVIAHGLAGATHAIGIPGTLGGLIAMNGGSQRRGIGACVVDVDVIDAVGRLERLDQAALAFAYRTSKVLRDGLTVVSARFAFDRGDARAMRREAVEILAARRAKFPKNRANCGSVFVSDPALYAIMGPPGAAIEAVGLKGKRVGGAQLSSEHANFIVNTGEARSADVLALIGEARERVAARTGIEMIAEVRYLAPEGTLMPAHLACGAGVACRQGEGGQ